MSLGRSENFWWRCVIDVTTCNGLLIRNLSYSYKTFRKLVLLPSSGKNYETYSVDLLGCDLIRIQYIYIYILFSLDGESRAGFRNLLSLQKDRAKVQYRICVT